MSCPRSAACVDPLVAGRASGRDGPSVANDGLHSILGHQLELLELGDPPLLLGRERGHPLESLELDVVASMLLAEVAEFLVLGREAFDEGLLIHDRGPPLACFS